MNSGDSMNMNTVCMIIMFIIIIFLFMKVEKISKNNNYENVTNTVPTDAQLTAINNQISQIYNMDVEAIRNLGAISKSLLTGTNYHSTSVGTPGQLTIPANNTILGGPSTTSRLGASAGTPGSGNLTVNGSLSFLPVGSVIMWAGETTAIPVGWVYCNGENNTPDFRDRMPIGGGHSHHVKKVGGGGSEGGNKSKATTHIRIPDANYLPNHEHPIMTEAGSGGSVPGGSVSYYANRGGGAWTKTAGSGQGWGWDQVSHPIDIQPYYTSIIFIMRVI
jgi:hypothetical protein